MKTPASWRTSTAGLAAIVAAIANAIVLLTDGDSSTTPDWGLVVAAIVSGIGLLHSRDAKVTSEQSVGLPEPARITEQKKENAS